MFNICVVLECRDRVVARVVGQYCMVNGIDTHVNNCKLPLLGLIRLVLWTLGYRVKVKKEEGEEMEKVKRENMKEVEMEKEMRWKRRWRKKRRKERRWSRGRR